MTEVSGGARKGGTLEEDSSKASDEQPLDSVSLKGLSRSQSQPLFSSAPGVCQNLLPIKYHGC